MVFTNVINPRSFIQRKNEYLDTVIKRGATLGANCTIVCGLSIGEYAFVAAGAVLTKDVPSFALFAGVPAKQIGWMSKFGKRIELPIVGNGNYLCPFTGDVYELKHNKMSIK